MRIFFQDLTGSNCRLGDQTLINLLVTESVDADYDTASAVCLAPGGPYAKGTTLHTEEGGLDTGAWVVEDPVVSKDGSKTWRRRQGASAYAHLPLVSYKLRRAGYLEARRTLSPQTVGADHYPPKFCTLTYMAGTVQPDLESQLAQPPQGKGTIDIFEYQKQYASWHQVNDAQDIILTIASWVGLGVAIHCKLDACADQYNPQDKPAITAIKEAAAWSGASVYLDRTGCLQIYDRLTAFPGGAPPMPQDLLSEELHDALFSPTHVTVIGTGQGRYWVPPVPGGPRADPNLPYRDPEPGYWATSPTAYAIEVDENLMGPEAAYPVVERIEIRDYQITPNMAKQIAQERLAAVYQGAHVATYSGPAEGRGLVQPLKDNVVAVTRRLDWVGTYYRYEMEITAPRGAVKFGSAYSNWGWW